MTMENMPRKGFQHEGWLNTGIDCTGGVKSPLLDVFRNRLDKQKRQKDRRSSGHRERFSDV